MKETNQKGSYLFINVQEVISEKKKILELNTELRKGQPCNKLENILDSRKVRAMSWDQIRMFKS